MRKSKKTFAILTIIAMVLMMVPVQAFADTPASNRLADADRVGTSIAIANNGWTSASTVIVAPADDANLVDALAVAPLAGQDNAPILMTYKDGLDAKVAAEIAALKATNVIAVGALSDAAVSQLKALSGVTVTAVKGADRFETAAKIAAMLTNPAGTFVVAYNGLADALSAASFAAANNYAIEIADTNGALPASEKVVGSKTYTVGGQVTIAGATAFAGADRYATNDAVLKGLTYKYDKVYVANGETLVDALAGSALAAKTQSPIVLANTTGAAAAAGVQAKLGASSQVIAFGGTAVVPDAVLGSVSGGQAPATLAVKSVSAASASSLNVTFTSAPADTTKVVFTVQRNTTPIAVTTSWDSTKTVATLTASSNLPEGSYTVAVKNDKTDLGTSTVSISQQKIAKITVTSSKLSITSDGKGYATYQVFDQYGNDITTSYLANSITFQTGVGTSTWSNGVIKVTPTAGSLIQFAQVVITGFDSNSGVSTSATLATSTALGTLSNIKLNSLTNANNAVLTDGDTTDTWFIDYTATDMSGNATKDLNLVKGGLILAADGVSLTSSSSYVTAQIGPDPLDSSKAAIQVQVPANNNISMDLPITITAMTYTGATSTLNLTLKKAAKADTFTLMAPAYDIATGETKAIPFVAYDQNGSQLTQYDDLKFAKSSITFSPSGSVNLTENVDGTASLMVGPFATDGPQIITAMTSTGKISTLTLNIQKKAVANSLSLNSSVLVNAMQQSIAGPPAVTATQFLDFGYKYGGFTAYDQYGRSIDMTGAPGTYMVYATSTDNTIVNPGGSAYSSNKLTLTSGVNPGQATVTFKLVDTSEVYTSGVNKGQNIYALTNDLTQLTTIDSKAATISVIKDGDINGYTIGTVANPLYAGANSAHESASLGVAATFTARENSYDANPYVYGTTSNGSKIILRGKPVIGAYVDSGDFAIDNSANAEGAFPVDYEGVYVAANSLPNTSTSSSTTLTVTIMGADNAVHTLSTPIKSTSTGPSASTIGAYAYTNIAGVSVNSTGDIVTVDLSQAAATTAFSIGKLMARFNSDGNTGVLDTGRAGAYIYAKDQYGTKALQLASIMRVDNGSTLTSGQFNVDQYGKIVTEVLPGPDANGLVGTVTVTGITNNGLQKSIQIKFIN